MTFEETHTRLGVWGDVSVGNMLHFGYPHAQVQDHIE